MPKRPLFDQVSVIGLGLIGGSLGMALRRGRVARRVIGFSRHEESVRLAKKLGAIDDGDTELCPEWLGQSQLVVLAVPPEAVVPTAKAVVRLTRHSFLMTDAASTKGQIVSALEKSLPSRIAFVGSHPMAGSEKSGIAAAKKDLFVNAPCIVTPTRCTKTAALRRVFAFWKALGGRPVVIDPALHDKLVARISHVPHLAAAGLTLAAGDKAMTLSAGGFADTTRISLSNPSLWKEICLTNRKEILVALKIFQAELKRLESAVGRGDGAALARLFASAQIKRRNINR